MTPTPPPTPALIPVLPAIAKHEHRGTTFYETKDATGRIIYLWPRLVTLTLPQLAALLDSIDRHIIQEPGGLPFSPAARARAEAHLQRCLAYGSETLFYRGEMIFKDEHGFTWHHYDDVIAATMAEMHEKVRAAARRR